LHFDSLFAATFAGDSCFTYSATCHIVDSGPKRAENGASTRCGIREESTRAGTAFCGVVQVHQWLTMSLLLLMMMTMCSVVVVVH